MTLVEGASFTQTVDTRQFRAACGKFATGVTVVTVHEGQAARGMTANSFSSISLNPPLIAVSIDQCNRTHDLLQIGDQFVVNVLASTQTEISARYAGCDDSAHTTFDDIPHHLTPSGLPLLDNALAHFICRVNTVYAAGDHSLF